MIAFLTGQPRVFNDHLIILTNSGVGYQVFVPARLLATNQPELSLFIYSHIREDRFELYGFETPSDQSLFELLITVSGLGPKTALALLNQGGSRIIEAVQNAELSFFTAVPRVGKKLAQKIIIELKTKLGGVKDLDLSPKSQNFQDVKDSLLALGYSEANIDHVLVDLDVENQDVATSIKQAMKLL